MDDETITELEDWCSTDTGGCAGRETSVKKERAWTEHSSLEY